MNRRLHPNRLLRLLHLARWNLPSGLLVPSLVGASLLTPMVAAAAQPHAGSQPDNSAKKTTRHQAIEGHVLSVNGDEIVLDLNESQGVRVGQKIQLWRSIKVRHPVTHRWMTDRFRTGTLVLVQVGKAMALAKVQGKLDRPVKPGDIALVPSSENESAAANQPTPRSANQAHPSGEAKLVCDMFDHLKGASIVQRIRAYEQYVRTHPTGKYAPVLYEEAQALRKLLVSDFRPVVVPPEKVSFDSPDETVVGTTLRLGIELTPNAVGAVVHVKNPKSSSYLPIPMHRNGVNYWVATIPATQVTKWGLQYFIEAYSEKGVAYAVVGAADKPKSIHVVRPPEVDPVPAMKAMASVTTDYADYNHMKGNDYAWQTEGDFGLIFADEGLRAIRTGFGVYRGAGGSLQELDVDHLEPRDVGLTYGYTEAEWGFSRNVGLSARLSAGIEEQGLKGGYAAALRLGPISETNLQLGFDILGSVGYRVFGELQLGVFPKVPISIRSEVLNQPAGSSVSEQPYPPPSEAENTKKQSSLEGDLGARGIIQVGYRITPEFVLSGRLSYQGRTINHAGPGFGAGVSYQW